MGQENIDEGKLEDGSVTSWPSEDLKGTRSGSTSGVDVNGVRRLEVVRWTAGSQHFSSQYEQG